MMTLWPNLKFSRKPTLGDKIILGHTLMHGISFQAAKYLEIETELAPAQAEDGWALGAVEDEKLFARDSEEIFETRHDAEEALEQWKWTQRLDAW